jgi:hypothetical protein
MPISLSLENRVKILSLMSHATGTHFSIYEASTGRPDKMFEFLDADWGERRIEAEPDFHSDRSDPRLVWLLSKMNLIRKN